MRIEIRNFLASNPRCERLLNAISQSCEPTFAVNRRIHNGEFHVFFLKPDDELKAAFGLNYEILAVYSPFPTAQPRIAQAIEQVVNEDPAKGRVDRLVVFVFSDDSRVGQWAEQYAVDHPDSRIMLAAYAPDFIAELNPRKAMRDLIQSRLYHHDLFDYRLPLNSDAFYFGRSHDLAKVIGAIDRGENFGVFGLRKSGKTSFVFKIRRVLDDSSRAWLFYYDCKLPEVRKLSWQGVIVRICQQISQRLGVKWKEPESDFKLVELLRLLVSRVPGRVVLAFDEIEFIGPEARLDAHWSGGEFIDLWQTLWGVQSELRKLSFLICGVIPRVVELERVNGVQNPLFGIVQPHYLRRFSKEDVKKMVKAIGGKVGVTFPDNAIDYLESRYGGHPYLVRLACSSVLDRLDGDGVSRPVVVDVDQLRRWEDSRERDMVPYIRHVIAELNDFYPIEYEVLELLSLGRFADYQDLAIEPEFVTHLKAFGIVEERGGVDEVSIPVAQKYIASEYRRRNKEPSAGPLIPLADRSDWYHRRIKAILAGMRQLAAHYRVSKGAPFLPQGGVPEADRLLTAPICSNEHECAAFFAAANRSLVESIEAFLRDRTQKNPIYEELPSMLPRLAVSLQRIKVYRHDAGHIQLTDPRAVALREKFLKEDLGGKSRASVAEVDFLLQQAVVESLMNAVQAELVANRLV